MNKNEPYADSSATNKAVDSMKKIAIYVPCVIIRRDLLCICL
jgi:hypothetical protein